jgi:serine/threonine-protein kinase
VRRFRRESRTASAIKSDHIVRILDSGSDENQHHPYIVMELLEGEDLQQIIDRVGPLPPETVVRIGVQALRGLQAAHAARIIHRDIKPSNLFLARQADGTRVVKLLDFGIAKMQSDPAKAMHSAGMTATGDLLGSPLYMSPEQVMSTKDVDARSDLWSLGSVLYCALTGYAPHVESSAAVGRLLVTICSKPIPPLRERASWVPEGIERAIAPALERVPTQRYTTALAMLDALLPHVPEGITLRDEILVTANTGEHVIVRPAIDGLAEAGGDGPTLPADIVDALAGTGHALAETNPVQTRSALPSKRWLVLPAVALLLGIPIALGLNSKDNSKENTETVATSSSANLTATSSAVPSTTVSALVRTPLADASAAPESTGSVAPSASSAKASTPPIGSIRAKIVPASATESTSKKDAPTKPAPTKDPLFERNPNGE